MACSETSNKYLVNYGPMILHVQHMYMLSSYSIIQDVTYYHTLLYCTIDKAGTTCLYITVALPLHLLQFILKGLYSNCHKPHPPGQVVASDSLSTYTNRNELFTVMSLVAMTTRLVVALSLALYCKTRGLL